MFSITHFLTWAKAATRSACSSMVWPPLWLPLWPPLILLFLADLDLGYCTSKSSGIPGLSRTANLPDAWLKLFLAAVSIHFKAEWLLAWGLDAELSADHLDPLVTAGVCTMDVWDFDAEEPDTVMFVMLKGTKWEGLLLLNSKQQGPYSHFISKTALTKLGIPVNWLGKITWPPPDIWSNIQKHLLQYSHHPPTLITWCTIVIGKRCVDGPLTKIFEGPL